MGDNTYSGDVMYAGIKSKMYLNFNEDDVLYMWSLMIPCSYSTGNYMIKTFKKDLGYDYIYGDGRYTWLSYPEITSIEYDYDYGYITIGYMDGTYSDN